MRLKAFAVLLGTGGLVAAAAASPAVVADGVCPYDAIDIEAFATCDGDRVARPDPSRLGHHNVVSVVDGFEGDVGPDGRRSLNGWKNAGLPWTARANAALVAKSR